MSKQSLSFSYTNKEGHTVTYTSSPDRPTAPIASHSEHHEGLPIHMDDMSMEDSYQVDPEQKLIFRSFCQIASAFNLLEIK